MERWVWSSVVIEQTGKDNARPVRPERKRRGRVARWLVPALIVLLLLGIYLAPQLPGVRDWLLGYALNAARQSGYIITYERTTGNVWSSLGLRNATVKGRGLDVALETLTLRYFLPSLITGELPLDIYAKGLTGDVDFKPTRTPGTTTSDPNARRSSGGLPIRVRLRDVNLQDISVSGSDVPFTLPNFSFSNLRVQNKGEVLHVITSVATEEGSADVEGDVRLEPLSINANVSRADVRIARHWWPGIDAGTAFGTLTVADGKVRADAQVVNGKISFLDGTVTDISGPVSMVDFFVNGNLTAKTLGGDIKASAGVDILNYRWFGEATSDNLDLKKTAIWLATKRLPTDLSTWPITGTLQTKVKAEGWTDVAVEGTASGNGQISAFPLQDLAGNFSFVTRKGQPDLKVDATGLLAQGQLGATLRTEGRDTVFDLTLANGKLLPTVNADATVNIRAGREGTLGQTQVDLSGEFLGRELNVGIPGTIDIDGWQNTVAGTTSKDETLTGAFVLGGRTGGLEGQINGADIKILGAPPLQLSLAASGNPSALPLTLNLESPKPFNWSIAGVDVPVNDAQITGTLEAIVLKDIQGNIGTLGVQGETWLNGENANVSFSLAETPLSKRVIGTLAATNGRVVVENRVVSGQADIQTGTLTTSGVTLQPISGTATFAFDNTLTASLESPNLNATYDGTTLTTNLNQTALSIVGQDIQATGSASLSPRQALDTLSVDVVAQSPLVNLNIQGQDGQLQITGTSSQLGTPLDIQSSVNLPAQTFSVNGSLNGIALNGGGSFGEALQATLNATQGADVMTLNVTGTAAQPELTLQGSLPAESLSPMVRVPLTGKVTADLSRSVAGYDGTVSLDGEVLNIPVNATITGNGADLQLGGTATAYGQELTLSGSVQPDIQITAQGEIGVVTLKGSETGFVVSGEGTTPVLNAGGFEVPSQPWSISGPVNDLSVSVGGSEIDIQQNNGLELTGNINQSIQRGNAEILLNAAASYRPATQVSNIDGTLTISTPTGQTILPVRGSLDDLQVSGNVPAKEVATLAGLPISLAGNVALDGNVSLQGETTYDVIGVWQANGQALNIAVQGTGSDINVTIDSNTLKARYTPQGFNINATNFDPAPFIENIPLKGTLTGNLGQEQGRWVGSLDAAVTAPLLFTGRLEGQGETLAANLSYEQQGITATATGAVLPVLALDVNAAYRDLATLQGSVNGSFSEPTLSGLVNTKEFRNDALGFVLPAQAFEVTGGLGETLLTLTNEGTNVNIARDSLTGQLVVPFILKEQAHTLQADVSGALTNPKIVGAVAGAWLNGQVNVAERQLQTSLSLLPSPWLTERNLGFIETQPVSIKATATSNLEWNADIYTTGTARNLPLELSASVRGNAATYDGVGALRFNGEPTELVVTGSGATLQAKAEIREADLAALRPLVNVPLAGVINGQASFDTTKEQPLTFDVRATGEAQGKSFELSSSLLENEPLALRGTYGTMIISLKPEGAGRYSVRYIDPNEVRPALVEGVLNLNDTFSLQAAGQLSGEALTIDANYNPSAQTGSWQVQLADSAIVGSASPEGQGIRLGTDISLVSGTNISLPLSAKIQAVLDKGVFTLERSSINTTLANREIAILLSGVAFPETNIAGRFDVTGVDTTGFHIVRREDAAGESNYALNLSQEGFAIDALLSPSFAVQSVAIRGQTNLNLGAPISYEGDLSWQTGSGFSGASKLRATLSGLTANVDLTGASTLSVSGHALWNDAPLSTLNATLPANATGALSGMLAIDASSSVFGSAYSASPVNLKSTLSLSGTVFSPVAQGSLQLSGSLLASGRLEYGLAETNRLELSGDDLNLLATSDVTGWNLAFAANELDIASFIPQLTTPTLSTVIRAESKRGQPLNVQVQNLALRSVQSQVTGQLSYDGQWQGDVQTDVRLEDLKVGVPLTGRLLGDVLVNGESLSGNLQAVGLSLRNSKAELGGNVIVTGQLSSPAVTARLIGSGDASGEVLFSLEPGQATTLSSTLRVGEFASNLNVSLQKQKVQGEGTLSLGDYQLVFAKAPAASSFTLLGQEKLLGWQLTTDLAAQRVSVSGDLANVVSNATGLVQLSGFWGDTKNWLSGGLENLSFVGVRLGDVAVASLSQPRSVSLQGESIDAAFNVSDTSWTVNKLEPTWNNFVLSLTGEGRGSETKLAGNISGSVAGESLNLPVSLSYLNSELALVSQGETLGGAVNINVRGNLQNGWQGDVKLGNILVQGFTTTIDGTLTGAFSQPNLQATLSALQGKNSLTGSLEVSSAKVALEQTLTTPQLDRPLFIAGTLFPQTDFELSTSENNRIHLLLQDGKLVSDGALVLNTNTLRVKVEHVPNDGTSVAVSYKNAAGLTLRTLVPRASLSDIVANIREQGLGFEGQDKASGWLVMNIRDGLTVQANDLIYQSDLGTVTLTGRVVQANNWQGNLNAHWQGSGSESVLLPWLSSLQDVTLQTAITQKSIAGDIVSSAGTLQLNINRETLESSLLGSLQLGSGQLVSDLRYQRDVGPSGGITLTDVPVFEDPISENISVSSQLNLTPQAISGTGNLDIGNGQLTFEGNYGLGMFPELFPQGSSAQRVNVRLQNIDVQAVPFLAQRVPNLQAVLAGRVQLSGGQIVGRVLSPDLQVDDQRLPLDLDFNGSLSNLEVRGTLGRSRISSTIDTTHAEGLIVFDQFPLEATVEAAVGDTGVSGQLIGAARFNVPWGKLRDTTLDFASEQIRLTQADNAQETRGNVAFRYQQGALFVDEASFEGAGRWNASGQISPEVLDFRLSARQADFTPILSLVPQLANFGLGASGSLELSAQGSFADPRISLVSPVDPPLNVRLGGSSYQLQGARLSLEGTKLTTQAQVQGISPITGNLTLIGNGQVLLGPIRPTLTLRATGNASVPTLGNINQIDATITATPETGWQLGVNGLLGNPFTITGSLTPLDVRLQGQDLNLRAPRNFLASSDSNADIRVRYEDGVVISGAIDASRVNLDLNREAASAGATQVPPSETTAPAPQAASQQQNRFLERIRFENIAIRAPQQITFKENFGEAELGIDVVLSGTAAQPELSGEAQSIRGTFRFAGRDFTIDKATAVFQPSQGIYPTIEVLAYSTFEKSQALLGLQNVELVEPSGRTFQVFLNLKTDLVEREGGGFAATDPATTLSSNARLEQASSAATAGGQRDLTQDELYSLLTLGRLQLASTITGQGSVAESVAQGAIDTTIEFFILSELQKQIGSALGVELFELRTTTLSSLLDGSTNQFGVSLRIGGYLGEDLFASYEIRTLDLEPDIAFANEFDLRYEFDRIELDLTGRLNFRATSFTPIPELSVGLGYAITPLVRLETNVDLAQARQGIGFGVSLRW
jgi:hypothetical protein